MKISTAITNCKKTGFAFLAVLFCLIMKSEVGFGQTITMSNTAQSGVCSGTYLDPGGAGNYSNNQDFTQTFTPSAGSRMSFNFTSFNTESGFDFLYIYNGNTTAAPLIGKYSNTALNGVTISSTANDGTLTFRFTSDGSTVKAGWTATISCLAVPYRATFISANTGLATWCAGETRNVTVTVKNTGSSTWTNSGPDINIGVKWNTNGANWTDYYIRTDANNLVPGATGTFTLPITASNNVGAGYTTPLAAGINNLTFDVVEETVSWFGDNGGNTGPGNSKFTSANQTINNPAAPTGSATQTFCTINNPTVANLVAAGSTIQWYTASTGGTLLAAATALVNGTHYYASQTVSGCEGSARLDVTATVSNPVAPTGSASQTFCAISNPTVANLVATGSAGSTIKWYTALTGGTLLAGTTSLANGTHYYASQTLLGCEGTVRLDVTATVSNPAAPTGSATQTFCAINNPTVANLIATGSAGSTIKWYTASTGGTLLAGTTALTNGTHYYASQTLSGCEGTVRLDVTATVSNPAAPTGSASQTFCTINNPTVANLVATGSAGSTIQWYSASSGGTAIASTTALVNGTHYYASQTVSGCEGTVRFDVTATVSNPAAPTGSATQIFCSDANPTVVNLVATGSTIQWYSAATGGSALSISAPLVSGTHYYASQTIGSCESATRLDVTVVINNPVSITTQPASTQTICASESVSFTVAATGTGPLSYQWYYGTTALTNGGRISGATSSTLTINPASATNATTITNKYYVIITGASPCSPVTSNTADLIVNKDIDVTSQPAVSQTVCQGSPVSFSVTITGTGPTYTYQWFKAPSTPVTTAIASALTTNTFTISSVASGDAGNYYVVINSSSGACNQEISDNSQLSVNPTSVGGTTSGANSVCSATNSGTITLAGQTGNVVRWESSTDNFATIITPITNTTASLTYSNLTQTTQYRAVVQSGICPEAISSVSIVTVYSVPTTSNAGLDQTICTSSANTTLAANTAISGTGTWSVVSGPNTSATQFSNVNNAASTFTPASGAGTYILRWTISNGPCAVSTDDVNIVLNTAPTISGQPANTSICAGSSTSFTVTAAGTSPTYQWQYSTDNATWNNVANGTPASITYTGITGATLNVVSTASAANGTYYYRCVIAVNGCSVLNSNSATLTVYATPTASNAGTSQTICTTSANTILTANTPVNGTGTWSVVSGPNTLSTQFSNVNNPTATFTPAGGAGTYLLKWTISNGTCTASSTNVNIVVNTAPTISSQPVNQATCAGTAKTFSVTAAGTSPTYQWQYSPDNTTWTNVVNGTPVNINYLGATTATLTVTPAGAAAPGTYYYRCVINVNGCSVLNSNPATFTINPPPTTSNAGANQIICSTVGFAVLTANSPTAGTGTWSVVSGPSTSAAQFSSTSDPNATFTPAGGAGTYTLRWTIVAICGTSTDDVVITLRAAPAITAQPTNQATCAGTAATFSVTATGTTPGYQWQYSLNGTTNWQNVVNGAPATGYTYTGNTSASLIVTPPTTAANATYYYRVIISVSGCESAIATSNVVTLTVYARPSAALAGTDQTMCGGNTISLGATAPAIGTGTWSVVLGASTSPAQFGNVNSATSTFTPTGTGAYTLRWTVSNGTCSSNTDNVTITVNVPPSISSQPTNKITCAGTATSFTITASGTSLTYQWQFSADNSTWANVVNGTPANITYTGTNTATLNVTPAPAAVNGVYYYRCIVSVNTCTSLPSSSATLTVNALPTITTAATTAAKCFSSVAQTTTLAYTGTTNNPTTYSINYNAAANAAGFVDVANAVLPASPITINIAANTPAGTYTGSITVKNGNGCSSNAGTNFTITINPLPVPTLTNSPASPVCANTNVTYTTDAGQTNYVWTFSGVAGTDYTVVSGGNSTSNTAVITWKTAGTKTVTVNYSNSNGCIASTPTSNSITVNALPSGTFTATENSGNAPNDNIICTGATVTFTAPAGNGSYIFKVNGLTVQTGTSNVYSSSTLSNGASVTVDVANASNCGVTFGPIIITVNPLPAPTLSADKTSICTGDNVTFTAGGGTNYNFKLNGSSVQSGASNTYSTTSLTNGASVTVDVTNASGCIATSTPVVITVNAPASGTLTAAENSGTANDNKICAGSNVTFTATAGFTNYNFKVNGASIQNGASNVYSSTTLTNGQVVTVDVTNAGNCTSSFGPPQTITVFAVPAGTITVTETSGTPNDNTICAGANVKFTATAGFTNYKFYLNGTGAPLQQGSSNIYNTTSLTNGDYITVVVTSSNGCTSTFTSPAITVSALPAGTLSATTTTICAGDNIDFTASAGFANYNFKVNGTSFQNGPSNIASHSGFINGDVVTVDVSNATGCLAAFNSLTITVNPLPSGTLTAVENSGTTNNDGIICTGANVVFTATSGYSNYNFKLNGTTVQYSTSNTYNNNTLANGDVVSVEITSGTGCIATFNDITVTVNTLPTVAAITGASSVCVGNTITLADATTGGVWSSDNTSVATVDATGIVTGVVAGTANISYTVTNANGCTATATTAITVNPLPIVAAITGNFNVCTEGSSQLADATSGGVWSSSNPAIAAIDATGNVTTGTALGNVTISYTVTNANGCSGKATATVTVGSSPFIAPITTTAPSFDVCVGNTITVNDVTPNGVWSSSDGTIATVNSSGIVTGVSAGVATINYTITPSCGTPVASFQDITVHALPTATITAAGTPVCQGSASSPIITFTGADGIAPYTFTYNINGGANQTIASVGNTATLPAPTGTNGTFTYNLVSVKDASVTTCSQNQTGSATVIIDPTPLIVTHDQSTCSPATVDLTAAAVTSGSTTGLTFTYYTDAAATNVYATPTTAGAGTYYIKGTTTGGCYDIKPVTVTVTSSSVGGTVTADATVCSGSNSGTLTLNGQSGNVIRWELSTDNFVTITTIANTTTTLNYNNLTVTTKYRAVVQNGLCSITNSSPATITVNPVSVGGTITANQAICSGSTPANLVLSGNTGGVVKWQKASDAAFTTPTDIANTSATLTGATIGALTATTYFRAVVQNNPCSVAYSNYVTITVNPLPTATISGTANVCQNASPAPVITFTGANGTAPYTFTYKINAGTNQTVNSVGNTATVVAPTGTVGTFTYTLVSVKDASTSSCLQNQTGTATITVSAPPVAFVLTPSGTTNLCQGNTLPLSAAANTSTTGSMTFSSTSNNIAIPDPGSISNNITVSGIPAGAIINSVSVTFKVTHGYDNDLILNLKAPNSSVLNLVNQDGGSGANYNNTVINSTAVNPINGGTAPFTAGPYAPDAINNVGDPIASNVTSFSSLFTTPNGVWTFEAADEVYCHGGALACFFGLGSYFAGTFNNWSITINYTVPNSPLNVVWSPTTDLYTDAGATTAYTGTSVSTVYAKPATSGTKVYTATVTNGAGCSRSQTTTLNVNPKPVVTITADYCAVAGKVQLTANATPAATSYLWSTGETTQTILVDESGDYSVTAFSAATCPGTATISVANELVTNGDFESGDAGFTTLYTTRTGSYYNGGGASGLYPEGYYAVDTSAYSGYDDFASHLPKGYHPEFHGKDHTTGHGKFMLINGAPSLRTIWTETVNVLPNTTYYFSGWGMNLNPGSPARLQFSVNGTQTGSIGDLNTAAKPTSETLVNTSNWIRFYGTWTSGATVTSAVISIVNLNTATGGNDFGLDDISFSTLSTFVNLQSAPGTDAQTVCVNSPITNIVYSVGSSASAPTVTGLPIGVTATFNGVLETISGTPTVPGTYTYTVTTTGSCQPTSATGTITVQGQKITLTSGSAAQTVCISSTITPIVYTVGGTGTGATAKGLPAGVTGTYNTTNKTYTISGAPSVAGIFKDTVITSGTCRPDTTYGTITVQNQTIVAVNPADTVQTVCINEGITGITYTLGGTATNGSVAGLPPGVSWFVSGTSFIISGTPTAAGTYHYTVTTSGTCSPGVKTTGTITVNTAATIVLSSATGTDNQTVCTSSPLTTITYNVTGATSADITSGALPNGVTGIYSGGVFTISGIPTVAGTYSYTISTSGGCSSASVLGTIVVQSPAITLTSGLASPTLCSGSTLTNIVFTISGGATGATLSGTLPSGVSGTFSGTTFTISGVPAQLGTFNYTVTTTGGCSPAAFVNGTITVNNGTVGGNLPATVVTCYNTPGTLNLTGQTGTVQRWESSVNGGTTWTNISNTTTTLPYNITVPTQFRALVKSGSCNALYSSIAFVVIHNYWTGITNTDWNVASNWSDNQVASTSCSMVVIPTGTPNKPQLTSDITVPSISIASGTGLDLNGHTLTINNAFNGSATGTIKGSATSGLIIGGNVTSLFFDPSNNILKTFTINSGGSATLGNALNITAGTNPGMITANGTLNAGGQLTLKSDVDGTAMVGESYGKILGNVMVERFIPARRAWRFMSVPLATSAQTIKDAWQEGVNNSDLIYGNNLNPHPGYGTHITSDNLPAHGFDVNTTTNPSLRTWTQATTSWSPALGTPFTNGTNITSFSGAYCLFVRGSRAVNLSLATYAPADNTILRTLGTLNETGNASNSITKNIAGNPGDFVFVGNPYASSINLLNTLSSSPNFVANKFYVWDPKLNGPGTLNVGGYVTFSNGVWTPSGAGSYPAGAGNPAIIQSGQAFMVVLGSGNTSGSVNFRQADKSISQSSVFGFSRTNSPVQEKPSVVYTNLMVPIGDSLVLADGVAAGFGSKYSANVDEQDARKLMNFDENIALFRDQQRLAIEFRPVPTFMDTLFFKLYLRQQPYVLKVFTQNVNDSTPMQAWLVDKYLKTQMPVDMHNTTFYKFTPNTDSNSYRNRFMLVFKRIRVATPISVNTKPQSTVVTSSGNESSIASSLDSGVQVFPNPVITGGKMMLKFSRMPKGRYQVAVNNISGTLLSTWILQHSGGNNTYSLQLNRNWAAGSYLIKVTNDDGYSTIVKLVISK